MHAFDFYKKQAMDELTHMEWVMEFLDDRDSIPYIPSVELQEKDYKNILDVVDASITREIETEKLYEDIWEIHKDFSIPATFVLALKVRQEQVEEIGLFTTIRAELEMATNGGKDLGGANWALIDNIFAKYK
jgi:ferritin